MPIKGAALRFVPVRTGLAGQGGDAHFLRTRAGWEGSRCVAGRRRPAPRRTSFGGPACASTRSAGPVGSVRPRPAPILDLDDAPVLESVAAPELSKGGTRLRRILVGVDAAAAALGWVLAVGIPALIEGVEREDGRRAGHRRRIRLVGHHVHDRLAGPLPLSGLCGPGRRDGPARARRGGLERGRAAPGVGCEPGLRARGGDRRRGRDLVPAQPGPGPLHRLAPPGARRGPVLPAGGRDRHRRRGLRASPSGRPSPRAGAPGHRCDRPPSLPGPLGRGRGMARRHRRGRHCGPRRGRQRRHRRGQRPRAPKSSISSPGRCSRTASTSSSRAGCAASTSVGCVPSRWRTSRSSTSSRRRSRAGSS